MNVSTGRKFIAFDVYRKAVDVLRPGDITMCTARSAIRPLRAGYAVNKGIDVFMEKLFAPHPRGSRERVLFGLWDGPDELHNLTTDLQHVKRVERLHSLPVQAQREFGDPCPSYGERVLPDTAVGPSGSMKKDKAARRQSKNRVKKQ